MQNDDVLIYLVQDYFNNITRTKKSILLFENKKIMIRNCKNTIINFFSHFICILYYYASSLNLY